MGSSPGVFGFCQGMGAAKLLMPGEWVCNVECWCRPSGSSIVLPRGSPLGSLWPALASPVLAVAVAMEDLLESGDQAAAEHSGPAQVVVPEAEELEVNWSSGLY